MFRFQMSSQSASATDDINSWAIVALAMRSRYPLEMIPNLGSIPPFYFRPFPAAKA